MNIHYHGSGDQTKRLKCHECEAESYRMPWYCATCSDYICNACYFGHEDYHDTLESLAGD